MGEILDINGPIVTVHLPEVRNGEQVKVGALELVGEVIELQGERAVVQVYEATESLRPREPVEPLGHPLSVELGPGLLGEIFDGVQRPLRAVLEQSEFFIGRGLGLPPPRPRKTLVFCPFHGSQARQARGSRNGVGCCAGKPNH